MEKDKFLQIFNNCVLNRLIFKHVKSIHNAISGVRYSWSEVIENPIVMARYSYLNELKLYYTDHSIGNCRFEVIDTFKSAIKSGNIETLKYLVELAKPISRSVYEHRIKFDRILSYTAKYGSLEMVKYICREFDKKRLNYHSGLIKSPLSGDIEMIKYLNEQLVNCDHSKNKELNTSKRGTIFYYAAKKGRIDIIEWLFENRSEDRSESYAYHGAIKGGHLHVVQYLLDINEPIRQTSHPKHGTLFDYSIYRNQFEIAKLLHQNNIRESKETPIDYAVSHRNISMLKWLNENTTVAASENAMNNAAINNDLEVLKWLQQHRTEGCSDDIIQSVSHLGHIEVIQWLYENQSSVLRYEPIYGAIINGHIELVKWFFEKRNEQTSIFAMDYAALNVSSEISNLQMIKWLHENHPEVKCTEHAMLYAIGNGHFETMKWLRENRTEISILKKLNFQSMKRGNAETIKWLSENFIIDWDILLINEAIFDNSEIVDTIIKQNLSTIDKDTVSTAFYKGDLNMIQWLHKNNIQGVFNSQSMENSIKGMQYPLVKWLYENKSDCRFSLHSLENSITIGHMGMIEYILDRHPEFGHQLSLKKSLEYYYLYDDIEMLEFLLDKIDFKLDGLKEYQKMIDSTPEYSDVSKTLLNNHIKKKIDNIDGDTNQFEIQDR
ncbi:hypothetical protein PPL_09400 [Heterostelium album PN500]|uniref:Ankyrin repeat protein n=1 Tax=Heterostelium pallidum (strain ATCC 26659 / Pp 5 / PN500) TaxID=670386 RepID=D3BLG6_HETP5|nr:hypothetical protein PPL_09400 [Heterostelium album PN500]EFA77900.1 hypothetical protein PPL_09400 [Heterostelium album PN500]|eukprot:XP_020430028.1 hypothetical protein PPL_09400 [Heterostelium album PN500]